MTSKSKVRETGEEGRKLLVTFYTHDGYFNVPLREEALCARVRRACENDEMISFTFDRDLRILSILESDG